MLLSFTSFSNHTAITSVCQNRAVKGLQMLNTPHFRTMRVSIPNLFFQSLWYFHAVIQV